MAEYQNTPSQRVGHDDRRIQRVVTVATPTPQTRGRSRYVAFAANHISPPRSMVPRQDKSTKASKGWWRIAIPSFSFSNWLARHRPHRAKLERAELETLFQRELQDFKTAYIRARF